MASPETLTDDELRRLDTIHRNSLIIATALLPQKKKAKADSAPRRLSIPSGDHKPENAVHSKSASPPRTLTDYELQRLDNIRRNNEMLASLNIQLPRTKVEPQHHRQSLRVRGISPPPSAQPPPILETSSSLTDYERRRLDPIHCNSQIIATVLPPRKKPKPDSPPRRGSLRSRDHKPEPSRKPPPENAVHSKPSSRKSASPPRTLTDYELKRLDNIRCNSEMMSSLITKLPELPARAKRPWNRIRVDPKHHRHSLRLRGISPPPPAQPPPVLETSSSLVPVWKQGALLIRDASLEAPNSSDPPLPDLAGNYLCCGARSSLSLRLENTVKVGCEMNLSIGIFPFVYRPVVACGNTRRQVGIWDAGFKEKGTVYLYTPHSSCVSGISIHPFSPTKMYTASHDGLVCLMDVRKETLDMVYSTKSHVYSICQSPHDLNSLYIGEGRGKLRVWDERTGKALSSWIVHERRIHTIDFNRENPNLMVTSSKDNKACIWDLRKMKNKCTEWVKAVHHSTPVHSAYFSPSGSSLATTSVHDEVRLLSGANYEDECKIKLNQTGPLFYFRAIWGWDDSYLYIGNREKAIDVISTADKKWTTLNSPYMTSMPYRFAPHPSKEGTLACGSSTGKVYLWTIS